MKKIIIALTLAAMASVFVLAQSTNAPGIRTLPGTTTNTNSPGTVPPSIPPTSGAAGNRNVIVNSNGVVISPTNFAAANGLGAGGTATNLVDNILTRNSYYVDGSFGNDSTGDGSSGKPWATIGKAETNAVVGSTIFVASGIYTQPIHRGGVIWMLARGCKLVQTDGATPVLQLYAATNFAILGEGEINNTASGTAFSNFDGDTVFDCNLELDLRAINGTAEFYVDQSIANIVSIKNALWYGGFSAVSTLGGGHGQDFQLTNVRLIGDDPTDFPFLVSGCVIKAAPSANPYRIGTWLVNTNLPSTLP